VPKKFNCQALIGEVVEVWRLGVTTHHYNQSLSKQTRAPNIYPENAETILPRSLQ
jgi:hypothetical protein